VREHVQRLGRLLRRAANKEAVLYEILTRDTAERYTSERRRDHVAYRAVGAGPQVEVPRDASSADGESAE
jgi:superfamily II DNA or RNA helicase